MHVCICACMYAFTYQYRGTGCEFIRRTKALVFLQHVAAVRVRGSAALQLVMGQTMRAATPAASALGSLHSPSAHTTRSKRVLQLLSCRCATLRCVYNCIRQR